MGVEPHLAFSHNNYDTIYHQATPNSLRLAFLVVSEFFDTPAPGVTKTLDFIVAKLNESEKTAGCSCGGNPHTTTCPMKPQGPQYETQTTKNV